ncbi:MAG: ATP synthase F1 subunit delta [Candidatus Omnitrophota bacterium]
MSTLIAQRYAKALFELAKDEKTTDDVHKDLVQLKIVCGESEEFKQFIINPIISKIRKDEMLTELFRSRVKPMTLNFLLFLARKSRLELLPAICAAFEDLYLKSNDILQAAILSKVSLSKAQTEQISEKFRTMTKKNIETLQTINESMLGGFKVQINDLVYDYSIESKLKKFKSAILNQ